MKPRVGVTAVIAIVAAVLSFSFLAHASPPLRNVIFITVDGVRYHEVLNGIQKARRAGEPRGTPVVPQFRKFTEEHGFLFRKMLISNKAALSLPGYRSLLTGEFETSCTSNGCSNIDRETLFDRLIDEQRLGVREAATFASWDRIGAAIESRPFRTVRSIAFDPIHGLTSDELEPFLDLEALARADRPDRWNGSRFDRYTFELGIQYLQRFRPRFLYLSFVEPDEYAHLNDYPGYVRSLREFDDRFVRLQRILAALGEYGENTSIVVTTDHGRGRGFLWTSHSREWVDSIRVWAAVIPAPAIRRDFRIEKTAGQLHHHKDIRPTLEVLLGIKPRPGDRGIKGRGDPLVVLK